ncbi:MAG: hypothetical protein VKK98_08605 [Cyanobacteriota bacterium]|nr:hypothetical protein [Cyanobacteriota bacterium]
MIKQALSEKWSELSSKNRKLIVGAAALLACGLAAWIGMKHFKYQKLYLEYSSELGRYKAAKLAYDSLAQSCQAAEQAQNAGMDAMNEIVYKAMSGGASDALQQEQATLGLNVSKAQSYIRDNCIGYEYNAPTPPVKPVFW